MGTIIELYVNYVIRLVTLPKLVILDILLHLNHRLISLLATPTNLTR